MIQLAPELNKTMEFVENYIEQNQYAPSVSEMAKEFKITIRSVYNRLWKLDLLGYIEFAGSRQIKLLWKR